MEVSLFKTKKTTLTLILISLSFLVLSCDKKEEELPTISKSDLYNKAIKKDPKLEIVIPEDLTKGVKCSDYGPGCVKGIMLKVLGLEVIALEFMTTKEAELEAFRIKAPHYLNWVFDEVKGEPVLEKFFINEIEAKWPRGHHLWDKAQTKKENLNPKKK